MLGIELSRALITEGTMAAIRKMVGFKNKREMGFSYEYPFHSSETAGKICLVKLNVALIEIVRAKPAVLPWEEICWSDIVTSDENKHASTKWLHASQIEALSTQFPLAEITILSWRHNCVACRAYHSGAAVWKKQGR